MIAFRVPYVEDCCASLCGTRAAARERDIFQKFLFGTVPRTKVQGSCLTLGELEVLLAKIWRNLKIAF